MKDLFTRIRTQNFSNERVVVAASTIYKNATITDNVEVSISPP
jgi:hypothetical protein